MDDIPTHKCFDMLLEDLYISNPHGNVWYLEWSKNKVSMILLISYCPFCGVELKELN